MESLEKSNKIIQDGKIFLIKINIPLNLNNKISQLYIKYNDELKTKEIISDDISEDIKQNMIKYANQKIDNYITFIENNLNVFLSGNLPGANLSPSTNFKLRDDYKWPSNTNVTPNIKFDSYKSNVLLFSCNKINVQVSCNRCQENQKINNSKDCIKCNSPLSYTYIPVFNVDYIGFLILKGCKFVCFEPSIYQFSCLDCSSNYQTSEISTNQKFELKCDKCHKKISVLITNLIYSNQQSLQLKSGQPLPKNGTCDHYKQSQRWFRFSCCNSLYPCDICHNKASDHSAEIANRMVCGLCSKEQSVKKECSCGMNIVKKKSKFWEGGKGNRNKTTMSRRDSKKYK